MNILQVYISDVEGWGLIIYDGSHFWRLNDEIYAPEADSTTFSINSEDVTLNIGVSSVIILPDGFIKQPSVLFKPMASKSGYGANLKQLRSSRSGGEVTYHKSNYTLPTQELARDISSNGIIIAGFDGFLACWNIQVPLVDPNVVGTHRGVRGVEVVLYSAPANLSYCDLQYFSSNYIPKSKRRISLNINEWKLF